MLMDLNITFDTQTFSLVSLLLKNNITNGRLELDMSNIPKEQIDELKDQFDKLKISYSFNDPFGLDDDQDDPLNDSSFSFSRKFEDKNELIEKEITDFYLVQIFDCKKGKEMLFRLSQNGKVSIDVVPMQKIKISGPKENVMNVFNQINEIQYIKCPPVTFPRDYLRRFHFINSLVNKLQTDFRICYEDRSKSGFIIAIYGKDQKNIETFREKFYKTLTRLLILFEIPTNHEVPGEVQEICRYLQKRCKKAFEDIKWEVERCRTNNLNIIYFLADCSENYFKKASAMLEKEAQLLSILNIYYNSTITNTGLKVLEDSIDDKVQYANLKTSQFRHHLLVGKAKYLKKSLKGEFISENSIEHYRLRFKDSSRISLYQVKKGITNNSAVTDHSEPKLKLASFRLSNLSTVNQFIDQIALLESSNDRSDLDQPASNPSLNLENEERKESQRIEKKVKTGNQIQEKGETKLYTPANRNSNFYLFESGDEESLDRNSQEYQRVASLFTRECQEIKVCSIMKLPLEEMEMWSGYETARKKHSSKKISEYVLFYESSDQPDPFEIGNLDFKIFEKSLFNSFSLSKNRFYRDGDFKAVLAYLVLVDETENEILAFCILYEIQFE